MVTSQAELLQQAQQGNLAASGRLLLELQPRLSAYIRRHLPRQLMRTIDATDVLQDTYIEAVRRLSSFESQGSDGLFRWMAAIARNQMLQLLRAHRTLSRGGDRQRSVEGLIAELAVTPATPSRAAANHELAVYIEAALDKLQPDYAAAVRLRHCDRLSVSEIAMKLNRTDRAVHMLCSRGLKMLREQLRSLSRFS